PATGAMISTIALPMVRTSKRVWVICTIRRRKSLAGLEQAPTRCNQPLWRTDDFADQGLDILTRFDGNLAIEQQHREAMHSCPGRQCRDPPAGLAAIGHPPQCGK